MTQALQMIEIMDGTQTENFSFHPPHLDKLLLIFKLFGIVHSSNLKGVKQKALLIYNVMVILLHVALVIVTLLCMLPEIGFDRGPHTLHVNLRMVCESLIRCCYISHLIDLYILSRKSRLYSLPRVDGWMSLPDKKLIPAPHILLFLS